jgi:hypothetical protein
VTRRHRAAAAAAVLASLATRAAADAPKPAPPPDLTHYVHLESASHVRTVNGSESDLPPGYFLDEPTWAKVDADVKATQDLQTRLLAENASMRKTLAGWQPGWYLLVAAGVGGILLGWYAAKKL